jgi:hypothetical protein
VPGAVIEREEPFEVCLLDVGEDVVVRITDRIDGTPGLSPHDVVEFMGETDGTYVIEPA